MRVVPDYTEINEGSKLELYNGDCIEIMKTLPDNSVDMVLTDPPYGTTECAWDSVVPFESMWEQLKRVTNKTNCIVMTSGQPFTTALISSNMKGFRYCWVWYKSRPTLFQHANNRPLKGYEDVCVFGKCRTYNPQGILEVNKRNNRSSGGAHFGGSWKSSNTQVQKYENYPNGIIEIGVEGNPVHPTQKPVPLMMYLIKTYTDPGMAVLDFTMGSGTTGVACKETHRNFIGIELDKKYFDIAKGRIKKTFLSMF